MRAVYRRTLQTAFRDPIAIADLAIDGDDLRRAGVPSGPALGRLLQELLDAVIEDPAVNTRASLLARVQAAIAPRPA
jgi:hypothetical protein